MTKVLCNAFHWLLHYADATVAAVQSVIPKTAHSTGEQGTEAAAQRLQVHDKRLQFTSKHRMETFKQIH